MMRPGYGAGRARLFPGDPIRVPVDLNLVNLQARVSSLGCCLPAVKRWLPELNEEKHCRVEM